METNVKGRMVLPQFDSYGRSLERNELSYEAATESKDDPAARRRLLTVGQVATAAMIEQSTAVTR